MLKRSTWLPWACFLIAIGTGWIVTDQWLSDQKGSVDTMVNKFELLETRGHRVNRFLDFSGSELPTANWLNALGTEISRMAEREVDLLERRALEWRSPSAQRLALALISEHRKVKQGMLPSAALSQSLVSYFKGVMALSELPISVRARLADDSAAIFSASDAHGALLLDGSGLKHVFQQLAEADPDEAVNQAFAIAETNQRRDAVKSVVTQMADQSPDQAIKLLSRIPNERERSHIGRHLFQFFLSQDPESAVGYAEQLQGVGINLNHPDRAITGAWFRRDAETALNWLDRQPEHIAGSLIESGIQGLLSEQKFDQARDLLPRVAESNQVDAIVRVASAWAFEDGEAAEAWANTLQDDARIRAISGIASSLSNLDPNKAWELVREITQFPLEPGTTRRLARTVFELEISSPGTLEEEPWFRQWLGEGHPKAFFTELSKSAARYSPQLAATIIESLASEELSYVAGRTASTWARMDPVAASRWAESLTDSASRLTAVASVAAQWKRYDQAAASAWAESVEDAAVRNALENPSRH